MISLGFSLRLGNTDKRFAPSVTQKVREMLNRRKLIFRKWKSEVGDVDDDIFESSNIYDFCFQS